VWLHLGSIKKTQGVIQHHQFNNQKANPMKPCLKKAKGHPKMNQVVPYHILLSKGEKTSVGGVVTLKEGLSQSNPLHANTSNFNLGKPCSHCNTYGHDAK